MRRSALDALGYGGHLTGLIPGGDCRRLASARNRGISEQDVSRDLGPRVVRTVVRSRPSDSLPTKLNLAVALVRQGRVHWPTGRRWGFFQEPVIGKPGQTEEGSVGTSRTRDSSDGADAYPQGDVPNEAVPYRAGPAHPPPSAGLRAQTLRVAFARSCVPTAMTSRARLPRNRSSGAQRGRGRPIAERLGEPWRPSSLGFP